jgi:transcriptional regulator with XRE-family HTH domain
VGERAVPHVRKFLGQRLRELRKHRGFSRARLGKRSSLSGKFIGEVERSEKSLEVPLSSLTDVRSGKRAAVPSQEAEKIFACPTTPTLARRRALPTAN